MLNKKPVRLISFLIAVLMIGAILSACAGGDYASYDGKYADEGVYEDADEAAYSSGSSGSSSGSSANILDSNRKIIETYYYTVETKTFDAFVTDLEKTVRSLGGYIESSNTYTSSYTEFSSTDYTVRVPSDKAGDLCAFVTENATVLTGSVGTEDVTLRYLDVESRLKALRTEQSSLEELLKSADSVSDIIEVRDRLTEVIYEIESYESQLRSMDADIEYTTFTISVSEVEHISNTAEASVWERIGNNLKTNFDLVGAFFRGAFVVLISGLPFWLLLGGIAVLVVVIVKLSIRRSRKKRAAQIEAIAMQQAAQPDMPQDRKKADVSADGESHDED